MKKLENIAEYVEIEALKELENNPRVIKKDDFEKLKTSIKNNPEFFEAHPIIASDRTGENVIIAGNQRWRAAKALGMREVPVVILHGLDEEKEKEIIIRSNVENGDWDYDILANEWDESLLSDWGVELLVREEKKNEKSELGGVTFTLKFSKAKNIDKNRAMVEELMKNMECNAVVGFEEIEDEVI